MEVFHKQSGKVGVVVLLIFDFIRNHNEEFDNLLLGVVGPFES